MPPQPTGTEVHFTVAHLTATLAAESASTISPILLVAASTAWGAVLPRAAWLSSVMRPTTSSGSGGGTVSSSSLELHLHSMT